MRKEVQQIDNDKVDPFKIIASFPALKARIDKQCTVLETRSQEFNELIGIYQVDGGSAFHFTRDRSYAFLNHHSSMSLVECKFLVR